MDEGKPGIASSYIFTLKPGDKVKISGPYGEFHPIYDSKREMMWIGEVQVWPPLRSQIMHMTKRYVQPTAKCRTFMEQEH